ncbi:MAG: desulfoferrodoxin [Dehalococcoidia bacterium]
MGTQLGKRYVCGVCNTEVLITKAGEGDLECCGQPMELQQPRPLPSSD